MQSYMDVRAYYIPKWVLLIKTDIITLLGNLRELL